MQSEKVELSALVRNLHSEKAELHSDLTAASDYMQELEEKVYSANKSTLDLLK